MTTSVRDRQKNDADRKEEALWLLERLVPGSGVNNLHLAFGVAGRLDAGAVRRALDILSRRHEALRTVFVAAETSLVKGGGPAVDIPLVERTCSPGDAVAELTTFVVAPFAMEGGSLTRALLLRTEDGDRFGLVVHHLIFDTRSAVVIGEEFAQLYTALSAGVPVPSALLEDVPALRAPEPRPQSRTYWREQLRGVRPDLLNLSLVRPPVPRSPLAGGCVEADLSGAATMAVRRLSRSLRVPEAVVLLAAYALLLEAHGAGPELVIGAPFDVRGPRAPRAVGYHVNVLPLRIPVDGAASFAGLVRTVRDVFFGAMSHATVPVDELLGEIPRVDGSWRHTVFRHVFNYVPDTGTTGLALAGLALEPIPLETGYAKFDLEFFLLPSAKRTRVRVVHNLGVVSAADARAIAGRYDALLAALGVDDGAGAGTPLSVVPVWSRNDTDVVAAAHRRPHPRSVRTVPEAVARVVTAEPEAVAVRQLDLSFSYADLWARAGTVRDRLVVAGVRRGDVVALLGRRGIDLAAAVFGVWRAGGQYLPLDPEHPWPRIAYQLSDSGAKVLLTHADAELPGDADCTVLPLVSTGAEHRPDVAEEPVLPERPAYMIYTSGSTGRPKGTVVSHASLANLIAHFADEFGDRALRTLWSTTFSFDISALEFYLPLVRGGRVVVAPDEARTDGRVLGGLVSRHDVTLVQATPTTWRLVVDDAYGALGGRVVLSGGEPLPAAVADRLIDTECELYNVYGPTETTIWSTAGAVVKDRERIGVGRPIANTTVFIADGRNRELPVGVIGELCIAGDGVAHGYHRRPELTAERFREHARHGRYYRTGDLARWLPDGDLEIIGRADRQVKLRGYRLELGEVESVLQAAAGPRGVAVLIISDGEDMPALVAAVEGAGSPETAEDLRERMRTELPPSAVPQDVVFVDQFPTTGNDKVDYLALRGILEERHAAPASAGEGLGIDPLTDQIVGWFAELLRRSDVTARTNFFAHGGHSLLGAQLAQRIKTGLGIRMRLSDVFDHPTPAGLAGHVRSLRAASP
ncbi:non-ribosomal peptide synthetase [Micromonospora wenchangensis]|uniref:non-ribosomal peptide synthetase n=1 Tax=Micromonospora wenchangensis TaxID=1185415 RepID=UPI003D75D22B